MAVLMSDVVFAGSDTLGTAYVLSAGIQQLGEFDLILCGDETIDGGTAQVSAQLAEFLDVPNIMHVSSLEVPLGADWRVRSQIEHGSVMIEVRPPVVLSVVKGINEPRYITLMSILEAEEKEIQIWSAADLTLSEPWAGLAGSPTQMADLFSPPKKKMAEMIPEMPANRQSNRGSATSFRILLRRKMTQYIESKIWVFVEQREHHVAEIGFELLAKARLLAERLDWKVAAH